MTKPIKVFLVVFGLLIVAGWIFYFRPSSKEEWKTYEFIPGEELAGDEEIKPVGFSFSYPSSWSYEIFKREEEVMGGENIFHRVDFLGQRLIVWADNHRFSDFIEMPAFAEGVKKTELTLDGQKAIKWIGKELSPIGESEKETVKIAIDALGDYTLVFAGEKEDEKTIDKMLLTLKFFRR